MLSCWHVSFLFDVTTMCHWMFIRLWFSSPIFVIRYAKREVHNLARFISVMKFHPLSWRVAHPYLLIDRFEDVTPPQRVHENSKCDRNVTLYGYLRGCNLKKGTKACMLNCISFIFYSYFTVLSFISFLDRLRSCLSLFFLLHLLNNN